MPRAAIIIICFLVLAVSNIVQTVAIRRATELLKAAAQVCIDNSGLVARAR